MGQSLSCSEFLVGYDKHPTKSIENHLVWNT
jgi:hypothetical protein